MADDNNLTENEPEDAPDDDIKEIMGAHNLDKDQAEQVQVLMVNLT